MEVPIKNFDYAVSESPMMKKFSKEAKIVRGKRTHTKQIISKL